MFSIVFLELLLRFYELSNSALLHSEDRGLDARQQMIDALKAQLNKMEPWNRCEHNQMTNDK